MSRRVFGLMAAGLLLASAENLQADQAADIRSQLSNIATSLTADNPAEAMSPFSKSYQNYDKLRDFFTGLTASFSIVNEVDVTAEEDSASQSLVTIKWAITLSSAGSNYNNQRSAEINARFVREKKKWKIVQFSPIDLFDPSQVQKSGTPAATSVVSR